MKIRRSGFRAPGWAMAAPSALVFLAMSVGSQGQVRDTVGAVTRLDAYAFSLPQAVRGYWVHPVSWLDDLQVDLAPPIQALSTTPRLTGFATPGEYEPLSFAVYAQETLEDLRVDVTVLRMQNSVIPAPKVDVVRRLFSRLSYNASRDQLVNVGRYLLRFDSLNVPARTFRQFWLTVHVPDGAAPDAVPDAASPEPDVGMTDPDASVPDADIPNDAETDV